MQNISKGFTLAEVLITLLIIGIIASIVIPGLIQDSQQAELKTAWKKAYAELAQTFKRMGFDNGGTLKGICSSEDDNCLKSKISPYLNFTKVCDNAESEGCWHVKWKAQDGTLRNLSGSLGFILNNGSLIKLQFSSSDCTESIGNVFRCGWIYTDINGFKGPNVSGKDIFAAHIKDNILWPYGGQNDGNQQCENSTGTLSGMACSAKYLYQ